MKEQGKENKNKTARSNSPPLPNLPSQKPPPLPLQNALQLLIMSLINLHPSLQPSLLFLPSPPPHSTPLSQPHRRPRHRPITPHEPKCLGIPPAPPPPPPIARLSAQRVLDAPRPGPGVSAAVQDHLGRGIGGEEFRSEIGAGEVRDCGAGGEERVEGLNGEFFDVVGCGALAAEQQALFVESETDPEGGVARVLGEAEAVIGGGEVQDLEGLGEGFGAGAGEAEAEDLGALRLGLGGGGGGGGGSGVEEGVEGEEEG